MARPAIAEWTSHRGVEMTADDEACLAEKNMEVGRGMFCSAAGRRDVRIVACEFVTLAPQVAFGSLAVQAAEHPTACNVDSPAHTSAALIQTLAWAHPFASSLSYQHHFVNHACLVASRLCSTLRIKFPVPLMERQEIGAILPVIAPHLIHRYYPSSTPIKPSLGWQPGR